MLNGFIFNRIEEPNSDSGHLYEILDKKYTTVHFYMETAFDMPSNYPNHQHSLKPCFPDLATLRYVSFNSHNFPVSMLDRNSGNLISQILNLPSLKSFVLKPS